MTIQNPQVFTDKQLQRHFDDFGFVRINLLNLEETEELLNSYEALPRPRESGFHCTMFSPDADLKTSVDSIIKNALVEKLKPHFKQHTALYGNFMVKEPGEESDWFVHQDWTYVDEAQHVSVAVWVPLVDLTEKNGVLCVVPGSQKIPNTVRGPGVHDPWTDLHQVIKEEYHEKVFLKAGEAIVWHHRLVHFSPPNMSDEPRIAATLICTPTNVPVYHYWKDPLQQGTLARKYQVDCRFFMNYDIVNEPANVPFSGLVDSHFPDLDLNRLKSFSNEPVDASFVHGPPLTTNA
ncbi:MAG: phytanoyl-CoA dioxygenase family protein [Flavobacteriales bacterium]|nr:phytanoyl-CoA dioxygenase family protein [Flavobacteriales bacterium]